MKGPFWPKIGFLEKCCTIWDIIPKAGIIKIYTSGWPKNPIYYSILK
jgi:hypothetical protein